MDLKKDGIKIKSDGKFLIATMPDGTVIPMQTNMIIENGKDDRGFIHCTVELKCLIPIADSDFEIIKQTQNASKD